MNRKWNFRGCPLVSVSVTPPVGTCWRHAKRCLRTSCLKYRHGNRNFFKGSCQRAFPLVSSATQRLEASHTKALKWTSIGNGPVHFRNKTAQSSCKSSNKVDPWSTGHSIFAVAISYIFWGNLIPRSPCIFAFFVFFFSLPDPTHLVYGGFFQL